MSNFIASTREATFDRIDLRTLSHAPPGSIEHISEDSLTSGETSRVKKIKKPVPFFFAKLPNGIRDLLYQLLDPVSAIKYSLSSKKIYNLEPLNLWQTYANNLGFTCHLKLPCKWCPPSLITTPTIERTLSEESQAWIQRRNFRQTVIGCLRFWVKHVSETIDKEMNLINAYHPYTLNQSNCCMKGQFIQKEPNPTEKLVIKKIRESISQNSLFDPFGIWLKLTPLLYDWWREDPFIPQSQSNFLAIMIAKGGLPTEYFSPPLLHLIPNPMTYECALVFGSIKVCEIFARIPYQTMQTLFYFSRTLPTMLNPSFYQDSNGVSHENVYNRLDKRLDIFEKGGALIDHDFQVGLLMEYAQDKGLFSNSLRFSSAYLKRFLEWTPGKGEGKPWRTAEQVSQLTAQAHERSLSVLEKTLLQLKTKKEWEKVLSLLPREMPSWDLSLRERGTPHLINRLLSKRVFSECIADLIIKGFRFDPNELPSF